VGQSPVISQAGIGSSVLSQAVPLAFIQRRQYEREVREQNKIRNKIPERPRAPMPERDNRYDNPDQTANRIPLPRQEETSPNEDLGLGRSIPPTREQANRGEPRESDPTRGRDGHTSGGSFARTQQESHDFLGNQEGASNPK
jgi:hypothetical protein